MGQKENDRRYYLKNRERILARNRAWNEANKERAKNRAKAAAPWSGSWSNTKSRCENPAHNSYEYYGGKGIRLLLTFDEMGLLWSRDGASAMNRASIDRIDSAKDYTLDNCRFIEQSENSRRGAIERHTRK